MIFLRVSDLLLRVFGGVFAVVIGASTALLEAVLTPISWLIPAIAAVVLNLFLCWFTAEAVGKSWAWALGAIPWFIVMIASVSPSKEGDQLANSYPGLVTFGAGALAFFVYVAMSRPRPRRRVMIGTTPAGDKIGVSDISR
jgi:membrane-associated phospholipid phosphatase